MKIQKGDVVTITDLCITPHLKGLIGKVMRKPSNNHYIIKFTGDSRLYIFEDKEVKNETE